ncbi:MAG: OB-fold-containig protein [Pseudomonadota bacterium]
MTALFTPDFAPFTTAVVILAALLALEVVMLLIGGSLISEVDAPEIDLPELEMPEIEALDMGEIGAEVLEIDDIATSGAATPALGWTGFGTMPFLIWFAALLTGFGASGIAIQTIGPAPIWLAVPVAGLAGIGFARTFGGLFTRAIPRTETAAQTTRQLARRRGTVTQGTSRRGRPAEVKVHDRYGNPHYIRAEPLRGADEIVAGQVVLVVYDHRASALRIVALD